MRAGILLFAALLLPMLGLAAPIENKWRLQFSGNARSDGDVVLSVTPKDGTASTITIPIRAGTRENNVARAVRDALRQAIGADYKIEVDDGEDVLVKRRYGRPRFNVTVVAIQVRGVRINLDQE